MSKNGKLLFKNYDPIVTSPYGYRIHPIYKDKRFHQGVDYGTNGKKIYCYAIEDGEVVGIGYDKSCGNYVYVSYPRLKHNCIYQHLDSIKVEIGQLVNENTIIGVTGETGDATGVHLHFGWFPSGNQNKAWNDKGWEDFEKYNYEIERPIPINPNEDDNHNYNNGKFKIGQDVIINGDLYISSDAEKPNGKVINKKTKITRYVDGAKHPYNTLGDLGWIDESCIQLYQDSELKVGDKVEIIGYGNGSTDGDKNMAGGIGWQREILKIYEGKPFPYQVGLNKSTVGFYTAKSLKKI